MVTIYQEHNEFRSPRARGREVSMMPRWWPYVALGGVLAVAACSDDKEQTPPTGPEMKVVTDPLACDFLSVKNLINSYFSSPVQQTAQGYEGLMETAGAQDSVAIKNGFKIMDLIGTASRSGSPPSPTVGSSLTKALTKCMFNAKTTPYKSLADGKGLDSVHFEMALSPSNGGVYYVVGSDYESKNVLAGSTPATGRLSAAGPGPATFDLTNTTFTLGTWTNLLAGNSYEGGRALVYAYPVNPSPIVYEWATIDPLTQFNPYALVSICDNSLDSTFMVHESNVGVLAYSDANLCGLPDATGTATGFRSNFKNTPVTDVNLAWVDAPRSMLKLNTPDTVVVRVTVSSSGEGVNGACVTYTGTNNNGQGTQLLPVTGMESNCDTPATDKLARLTTSGPGGAAGYVTFIYSVTKTGGLIDTAALDEVVGRSDLITSNTLIAKTNVKP